MNRPALPPGYRYVGEKPLVNFAQWEFGTFAADNRGDIWWRSPVPHNVVLVSIEGRPALMERPTVREASYVEGSFGPLYRVEPCPVPAAPPVKKLNLFSMIE